MSHMEVSSDLIPECDLPGVPARNPCGEQPLHVAQEHHSVDTVVLTTGLLLEQHTMRMKNVCHEEDKQKEQSCIYLSPKCKCSA